MIPQVWFGAGRVTQTLPVTPTLYDIKQIQKENLGFNVVVNITIPTRFARVRPIVPVPQQTSKSKVSGPKQAQSPAREYNFSAARVFTCASQRT